MVRIRASKGFWGVIAAIAMVPPVAFVGLALTSGTSAERYPVLDNRRIGAWIGTKTVIAADRPYSYFELNLTTGSTMPVPDPIPSVFLSQAQQSWNTGPHPSPDGRWLLYTQTEVPAAKQRRGWFWLLSTRGEPSPWLRVPNPHHDLAVDRVAWLPDSSGWVVQPGDRGTPTGFRYTIAAPDTPTTIALAGPMYSPSPDHPTFVYDGNPKLVMALPDSTLVFDTPLAGLLLQLSPDRMAPVREVQLRLPDGFEPAHPANVPGNGVVACDEMVLLSDGRTALACLPTKEDPIAMDFRQRFHLAAPRSRFVRLSTDAPPQTLLTVRDRVSDFSLAPDGKTLIYWTGDRRAYKATLP